MSAEKVEFHVFLIGLIHSSILRVVEKAKPAANPSALAIQVKLYINSSGVNDGSLNQAGRAEGLK